MLDISYQHPLIQAAHLSLSLFLINVNPTRLKYRLQSVKNIYPYLSIEAT